MPSPVVCAAFAVSLAALFFLFVLMELLSSETIRIPLAERFPVGIDVERCISTRPRSKFGPQWAECLSKPCSENAFLDLPVVNVIVNLYLSIALYIKYNL